MSKSLLPFGKPLSYSQGIVDSNKNVHVFTASKKEQIPQQVHAPVAKTRFQALLLKYANTPEGDILKGIYNCPFSTFNTPYDNPDTGWRSLISSVTSGLECSNILEYDARRQDIIRSRLVHLPPKHKEVYLEFDGLIESLKSFPEADIHDILTFKLKPFIKIEKEKCSLFLDRLESFVEQDFVSSRVKNSVIGWIKDARASLLSIEHKTENIQEDLPIVFTSPDFGIEQADFLAEKIGLIENGVYALKSELKKAAITGFAEALRDLKVIEHCTIPVLNLVFGTRYGVKVNTDRCSKIRSEYFDKARRKYFKLFATNKPRI
jgi:hypothetical protein